MAWLRVTDGSGRHLEHALSTTSLCTLGRAPDNTCVLDDSQASRHRAFVTYRDVAFAGEILLSEETRNAAGDLTPRLGGTP